MKLIRTDAESSEFINLVKMLDANLAATDGEENVYYSRYNKIEGLMNVVIVQVNGRAVSCGAIKEFDNDRVEIKRMFTVPEYRAKGIATAILEELEKWARELEYSSCILETGKRQVDALRLYSGRGYKQIANYGPYIGIENSVCFEKKLF